MTGNWKTIGVFIHNFFLFFSLGSLLMGASGFGSRGYVTKSGLVVPLIDNA